MPRFGSVACVVAAVAMTVLVASVSAEVGFHSCNDSFVNPEQLPAMPNKVVKLCREGYFAIAYDVEMKIPSWTAYYITPADVETVVPGRDSFFEDPDLEELDVPQAPVDSDAFNTSWNRGHLAPSHILSRSDAAKHSCYAMSNIAPQGGKFNQRGWQSLETHVFDWIKDNDALHIITGVAFDSRSRPNWTYDKIAVPDYYFKVVCNVRDGEAAGFYGRNLDVDNDDALIFRTVADVEKLFGGALLPSSPCRKDRVNADYWWGSEKQ